jgi:hypothetical protein
MAGALLCRASSINRMSSHDGRDIEEDELAGFRHTAPGTESAEHKVTIGNVLEIVVYSLIDDISGFSAPSSTISHSEILPTRIHTWSYRSRAETSLSFVDRWTKIR